MGCMSRIAFFSPERALAPLLRRARLMRAMLDRLGLQVTGESATGGSSLIADAAQVCVHCQSVERCERWLAGDGEPGDYHEFCPNAERFERAKQAAASAPPVTPAARAGGNG